MFACAFSTEPISTGTFAPHRSSRDRHLDLNRVFIAFDVLTFLRNITSVGMLACRLLNQTQQLLLPISHEGIEPILTQGVSIDEVRAKKSIQPR
jgi:hypothetical protein